MHILYDYIGGALGIQDATKKRIIGAIVTISAGAGLALWLIFRQRRG